MIWRIEVLKIFTVILLIFGLFPSLIFTNQDLKQSGQSELLSKNIFIEKVDPGNARILADTIPADFPVLRIDSTAKPSKGSIFMESYTVVGKTPNYLMVLDSNAKILYYDKPVNGVLDFKLQPNGLFSHCSKVKLGVGVQPGFGNVQNVLVQEYILDTTYKVIDSVQMKNEYLADFHDFVILPNGNYVLISYESIPIDMSKLIPGGNPNATVVGSVIQELDNNKNCVFQWRSLDHIPVLATKDDPLKATFEHVHVNSVFLDKDGNLIASFATTGEIVKIDMITGDLIWRFGGDNNQFEVTGDVESNKPNYFTMQHDVKRLNNGNLLFLDNSYLKNSGWDTRAVEYSIDETNKKASLVWEYTHNPSISAFAMGSAQRLNNGNTLISWGLVLNGQHRTLTEVTKDKQITFELSLPPDAFSYRVHKYDLPVCKAVANIDKYEMVEGNTYKFNNSKDTTGIEMLFIKLSGFMYNTVNVKKYNCSPQNIEFGTESPVLLPCRFEISTKEIDSAQIDLRFDITKLPPFVSPENMVVYSRPKSGTGIFKPVATRYDVTKKLIIGRISEFGEFVIGYNRNATKIEAPYLVTPTDKKVLINNNPVKLVWGPAGRYDSFQMQIAEDSSFTTPVIDTSNVTTPIISYTTLKPNKTYSWRTKTYYRNLASEWSSVQSFSFKEPYLTVVYPNGGEKLVRDSSYIFNWDTNLSDSLSLVLLKNGEKYTLIKDNIFSYSNSFSWQIPDTMPESSDYSFLVISNKDTSRKAQSTSNFAISATSEDSFVIDSLNTVEVAPNPATGTSVIGFKMKDASNVRLSIVDLLGKEKILVDGENFKSGVNYVNLNTGFFASGVYFIVLKTDTHNIVKKIVIVR